MSDEQKAQENEVFEQELSLDDLDAVAGGYEATSGCDAAAMAKGYGAAIADAIYPDKKDANTSNCDNYHTRQIYGGGGFPNCAATVEDGSWCKSSDACYNEAIDYKDTSSCSKAWR